MKFDNAKSTAHRVRLGRKREGIDSPMNRKCAAMTGRRFVVIAGLGQERILRSANGYRDNWGLDSQGLRARMGGSQGEEMPQTGGLRR